MIRHVYIGTRLALSLAMANIPDPIWGPEAGQHFAEYEASIGALEKRPHEYEIVTFSPVWLNYLPVEKVRVVLDDGSIHAVAVDKPEVAEALKYSGVGEIWVNVGEYFLAGVKKPENKQ